jgi:hypothetical protein
MEKVSFRSLSACKISYILQFNKDAGIVYKSFRIETNRVILEFFFCKTNPRVESFENRVTNQIRKMNLLKTAPRIEYAKRIF